MISLGLIIIEKGQNSDVLTFYLDTDYDALEGDIFLDETYINDPNFLSHLVMHELGHSIGLAHPHDGYLAITGDDPSLYKDEQGRSEEIQVRNSTVFLGNKTKQKNSYR